MDSSTTAVVMGRWQLPHFAHDSLIQAAFEVADQVVVVIGSAWRSRNPKNPFTYEERVAMLKRTLNADQLSRVRFLGVRDVYSDSRWVATIQDGVSKLTPKGGRIKLVGFLKDASSYYLKMFPSWEYVDSGSSMPVDATLLRDFLFGGLPPCVAFDKLKQFVPAPVLDYLALWVTGAHYEQRCKEHRAIVDYRKKWATDKVYRTCDAWVEAAEHLLLVERGQIIGLDTNASPGGFQEADESSLDGALRELTEETGLAVSREELLAGLVASQEFKAPGRSPRGNIHTEAYYFKLPGYTVATLPVVQGMDDAKAAQWIQKSRLPDLMHNMFDDHHVIMEHFMGEMTPTVALQATV